METVSLYKRPIGLLFILFVLYCHMIKALKFQGDENNVNAIHNVHKLLELAWLNEDTSPVLDKEFYMSDIQNHKKSDNIKKLIFDELKKEFGVASCIFWGVAEVGDISKAVVYLHTTKYVFKSLRYSLDLLSKGTACFGKMEQELAPFATVLNSVLKYGDKQTPTEINITYSGDTFMCQKVKTLKMDSTIAFHTFMPSSEDLGVAIKHANKKGDDACLYFFINNQHESKYSPRTIGTLSFEPTDKEILYPIGAAFTKIPCHGLINDDLEIPAKFQMGINLFCLVLLSEDANEKLINVNSKCD